MKLNLQYRVAGVFAICFAAVGGFVLDESCETAENRPIVLESLEKAFHMVEIAINSLEQRPWSSRPEPVFLEISIVANWLFKDAGNSAPREWVKGGTNTLDRVYRNDLFVVNCDPKPLKRTKSGRLWDAIRQVYVESRGRKINSDDTNPCNVLWLEMYTEVSENFGVPSIIHICPNYFKKMKQSKFLSTGDFQHIDLDATGKRLWVKPNTAMDLAAVMDVTFLHEFTHTFSGGELEDVGELFQPYGWLNTLNKPADESVGNAENIAMFGLAHRMLVETPMKPQLDGSII
ncbi:hypothetical protein HYFRA_00001540 [Hymenoscyphus fraxineus]|uniref:Lysine-specific metallo-endopeptidase domain-containing protein n=1 Tax=Hymenoscyphus fraxineus TaxID=746836 RepID=A0A9N9L9X3_9HELO|nr:hypothetical protein HYFRA_00001540 [Hymenoscyphus fraxineus]